MTPDREENPAVGTPTDMLVNTNVTVPISVHKPEIGRVYMVWDRDLEAFKNAVSDVSTATGFVFFCLGAMLTLIVSLATTTMSAPVLAVFVALLVVSTLATAWFAIKLLMAVKAKNGVRLVPLIAPAAVPALSAAKKSEPI